MITITEALAEIKTIEKRLEKKRQMVLANLFRQEGVKDPHDKDGGTPKVIGEEFQAIADLNARIVSLRRGIQKANEQTIITIEGRSMSIAEWLVWRRDVAPKEKGFIDNLRTTANQIRDQARRNGNNVVDKDSGATKPTDFIINIDELKLNQRIEQMETVLGTLDGQLSLKNATISIVE